MKVYSIGRDLGCDIIIDDNTDVISRRHATLNVESSGKMTIVDLSHNGTYVNGIRINQNVPVPVTRNDTVSFAHVAQLDWDQIPNTQGVIIRYVLLGLLAILLIGGAVWGFTSLNKEPEMPASTPVPAAVDSTDMKQKEERMKEQEKQKMDSIKKHVQDSLNKVRQKKTAVKTKTDGKAKTDDKSKEKPKTDEPKPKKFR